MCPVRLALFVLIVCCSGCGLLRIHSLTESAPLTIPSHTGRHQFSGQIGYGGKRGFDGSLSYSLTNYLALGGTAFVNQQTFQANPLPGWSDGYSLAVNSVYWEGQASHYRATDKSLTWAVTGGYGRGSRQLRWVVNQLDARYSRCFVQVSGNWLSPLNRQIGAGIKLHYTQYASASLRPDYTAGELFLTGTRRGVMGLDFAQTIRFPLSSVLTLNGQFGFYVPLSRIRLETADGSFNSYANAGLIATVGLGLFLPAKR